MTDFKKSINEFLERFRKAMIDLIDRFDEWYDRLCDRFTAKMLWRAGKGRQFSDLVPPPDGTVYINQNGVVVTSVATIKKLNESEVTG